MQVERPNKRIKILVTLTSLILSFVIVIMIIKGINHIAYTSVIAEYGSGDGLGGSYLIIQSNNTFIYKTYLDIRPTDIVRGTWTRSNDTMQFNGSRCFYDINKQTKDTIEKRCIVFENAKLKMYRDSIVYISGKSSIYFMKRIY